MMDQAPDVKTLFHKRGKDVLYSIDPNLILQVGDILVVEGLVETLRRLSARFKSWKKVKEWQTPKNSTINLSPPSLLALSFELYYYWDSIIKATHFTPWWTSWINSLFTASSKSHHYWLSVVNVGKLLP